jgi:hypothetical protein
VAGATSVPLSMADTGPLDFTENPSVMIFYWSRIYHSSWLTSPLLCCEHEDFFILLVMFLENYSNKLYVWTF